MPINEQAVPPQGWWHPNSTRTPYYSLQEPNWEEKQRNLTTPKPSVITSFYKWPHCFPSRKCAIWAKFKLKGSFELVMSAKERISNTWSCKKPIHVLLAPHGSVSLLDLYHQPIRDLHGLMSWSVWEHQVPVLQECCGKESGKAGLKWCGVRTTLPLYIP